MTDVYIFQADLLCAECGEAACNRIESEGHSPSNPADETTYDSDEYPKGPYPHGGGESDHPQHCGHCSTPLDNPVIETVQVAGTPVLENWLTFYGAPFIRTFHT